MNCHQLTRKRCSDNELLSTAYQPVPAGERPANNVNMPIKSSLPPSQQKVIHRIFGAHFGAVYNSLPKYFSFFEWVSWVRFGKQS
jgi:hypothetical protein